MRIRQNLHNTLSRKFVAQVQEYQEMQTKYKNKYRDRVGRQLKVVKPDASQVAPPTSLTLCPSFWFLHYRLASIILVSSLPLRVHNSGFLSIRSRRLCLLLGLS